MLLKLIRFLNTLFSSTSTKVLESNEKNWKSNLQLAIDQCIKGDFTNLHLLEHGNYIHKQFGTTWTKARNGLLYQAELSQADIDHWGRLNNS